MSCISGPVRWNAVALGYFWLFALLNRCIFSSLLPHSELGKSRQLPSTKAPPVSKALALSGNYHKLSGLHMGCLCLVQVGSRASARVHSLATDEELCELNTLGQVQPPHSNMGLHLALLGMAAKTKPAILGWPGMGGRDSSGSVSTEITVHWGSEKGNYLGIQKVEGMCL